MGFEPGAKLLVEIRDEAALLFAHPRQTAQIFTNLLGAAAIRPVVAWNAGEQLRHAIEPPGFAILRFGVGEQVESDRDQGFDGVRSGHVCKQVNRVGNNITVLFCLCNP